MEWVKETLWWIKETGGYVGAIIALVTVGGYVWRYVWRRVSNLRKEVEETAAKVESEYTRLANGATNSDGRTELSLFCIAMVQSYTRMAGELHFAALLSVIIGTFLLLSANFTTSTSDTSAIAFAWVNRAIAVTYFVSAARSFITEKKAQRYARIVELKLLEVMAAALNARADRANKRAVQSDETK